MYLAAYLGCHAVRDICPPALGLMYMDTSVILLAGSPPVIDDNGKILEETTYDNMLINANLNRPYHTAYGSSRILSFSLETAKRICVRWRGRGLPSRLTTACHPNLRLLLVRTSCVRRFLHRLHLCWIWGNDFVWTGTLHCAMFVMVCT